MINVDYSALNMPVGNGIYAHGAGSDEEASAPLEDLVNEEASAPSWDEINKNFESAPKTALTAFKFFEKISDTLSSIRKGFHKIRSWVKENPDKVQTILLLAAMILLFIMVPTAIGLPFLSVGLAVYLGVVLPTGLGSLGCLILGRVHSVCARKDIERQHALRVRELERKDALKARLYGV